MPRGRPEKQTPSERELEIMGVLWDRGSGTVAEVRERFNEQNETDLAYTTVLALLQRLKEKEWVTTKNEGRAHRYFPAVTRDSVKGDEVSWLTGILFEGNRELMLTELVSDRKLTKATLERLRALLDARLKERGA